MAEGKPIKFSDIIEQGDPFKKATDGVLALKKAQDNYIKSLKANQATIKAAGNDGKGLKAVNAAQKETIENTKQITNLKKQEITLTAKLKAAYTTQADKVAQLNQQNTQQRQINQNLAKQNLAAAGSYAKLSAEMANNLRKFKEMKVATKADAQARAALGKQINKQNNELKSLDKTMGNSQRKVGDYAGQVGMLGGKLGVLPLIMMKVQAAQVLLSKGFKTLKLAIMSTGIGALVIALGSVAAYFNSSEEAAAKFQKIIVPFKILFGNLSDLVVGFGEKIVWAFEHPLDALKGFWEAIKSNVVVRIDAVMDMFGLLGKTVKLVFEGEFSKAAETAGKAGLKFADMMTGVEDSVIRATGAVAEFAKETAKESKQAKNIALERLKLDQDSRRIQVENAKRQAEIDDIRLQAAQRDKFSAQERIDLMNRGIELVKITQAAEESLALRKFEFSRLEHSFSISNKEDLQEEADLETALIQLQSTGSKLIKRLETEKQTAIRETNTLLKSQKREYGDHYEAAIQSTEEFLEREEELVGQELKTFKTTEQAKSDIDDISKAQRQENLEASAAAIGMGIELMKEGTAEYKILATAQALINTYLAASNALASAPNPILGIVLAALAVVTGLINVAKINEVSFAEGSENVHDPNAPLGTDTIRANVNRGERILTTEQNRPLLAMGISNKELPGLANMGLSVKNEYPLLASIAMRQLSQQERTNKMLGGWKYVDKHGNEIDLEGNKKIYLS